MIDNPNKVPQKQWKRWSDFSQELFNDLFAYMDQNQHLFTHPKTIQMPKEYWRTSAWNSSWMAADLVRIMEKEKANGEEKDKLDCVIAD